MANLTDSSAIAARYSAAIFALGAEKNVQIQMVQAFAALAEALNNNAELNAALHNPVITREAKAQLLQAGLKGADALALSAVSVIALQGRSAYIPAIAEALTRLLAQANNEVQADIVSAIALSAAQQKSLQDVLAKATGKKITLNLQQDAAVIGGVSVRIGSQLLDGTLAAQLTRITQQLKQAA